MLRTVQRGTLLRLPDLLRHMWPQLLLGLPGQLHANAMKATVRPASAHATAVTKAVAGTVSPTTSANAAARQTIPISPPPIKRLFMTRPRNRSLHRRRRLAESRPSLRFTPYTWAKLLFLRDAGPTEVGGFGISAADDLLLIEDIQLVRQCCTRTSVVFDDAAVADHFDACVDAGLPPERFARIWIHTHPGSSPEPSHTDEQTFARVFGGCDWAVMAILAGKGSAMAGSASVRDQEASSASPSTSHMTLPSRPRTRRSGSSNIRSASAPRPRSLMQRPCLVQDDVTWRLPTPKCTC